jgi:hypothetical protein
MLRVFEENVLGKHRPGSKSENAIVNVCQRPVASIVLGQWEDAATEEFERMLEHGFPVLVLPLH